MGGIVPTRSSLHGDFLHRFPVGACDECQLLGGISRSHLLHGTLWQDRAPETQRVMLPAAPMQVAATNPAMPALDTPGIRLFGKGMRPRQQRPVRAFPRGFNPHPPSRRRCAKRGHGTGGVVDPGRGCLVWSSGSAGISLPRRGIRTPSHPPSPSGAVWNNLRQYPWLHCLLKDVWRFLGGFGAAYWSRAARRPSSGSRTRCPAPALAHGPRFTLHHKLYGVSIFQGF